jgi:hypothetical protein
VRSISFLFKAPLILLFLVLINLMTSPGHWWVQWPALGIGIAWVLSLMRVVRAVVVAGGLAALGAYLLNRQRNTAAGNGRGPW